MTKIICNVYKNGTQWLAGPPGIGDFVRGSAWLLDLAASGRYPGLEARICLSLAPAAPLLNHTAIWHDADPASLAAAPEYFTFEQYPSLDREIERFMASQAPSMLISTNRSWRGTDDAPSGAALASLRAVFDSGADPDAELTRLKQAVGAQYDVLHVRDEDRTSPFSEHLTTPGAFAARMDAVLDRPSLGGRLRPERTICVSNNPDLRARLCAARGYVDAGTVVRNAGFAGIFSAGELADMLLFRDARHLLSVTAFTWNSGFSVWSARLFDVPAEFVNAETSLDPHRKWKAIPGRLASKVRKLSGLG